MRRLLNQAANAAVKSKGTIFEILSIAAMSRGLGTPKRSA
jgi:hypothetical protein